MQFCFRLWSTVMSPPFAHAEGVPVTSIVEARDDEPLLSVYARGAAGLGISVHGDVQSAVVDVMTFVQFALDGEDSYDRRRNLRANDLEIVADDGLVWFGRTLADTSVADLLRTSRLGLIPGDVSRPNFIAHVPAGGVEMWLLGWPALIGAYVMVRSAITLAADLDGALGFVERLRRVRSGSAALTETAATLERRKARPDALYELLNRRPWSALDLADRLGCDESLAIGLLELFGFEQAPSGLWRPGTSADAEFLRMVLDEVIVSANSIRGMRGGSFEERIRHLIDHGERPPLPDWA